MANALERTGFVPIHDAHAIEQLNTTVIFARPLSDTEMRQATESMSAFEATLPGFGQIMGMGFSIGPQGVSPMMQNASEAPAGVLRTYTDPKGVVVKELKLERQALTFRTLAYTRWSTVWKEARNYFEVVLARVPNEVMLSGYTLSYSDKFIWHGVASEMDVNLLLRQDSEYITPKTFSANDLWHCHSGQFVRAKESVKRLIVVDCDCVDEQVFGANRRVVRIGTTLTELLNQPGFEQSTIPLPSSMNTLDEAFRILHNELKKVFSEIVSDAIAETVGLNGDSNAN